MKIKVYSLIAIFLFSIYLVQAQPTPPVGMSWRVATGLTDEFDTWDSNKWYKLLWNYPEPVSMQSKNSGVTNGNLWIKATLGTDPLRWFETCRISSKIQIKFPMYTECRMKTAHISAYNTFWLNNGNSVTRDEIDICENVSNPSNPAMADWAYTMNSQYFIVKNSITERNKGNFDNRNLSANNAMKAVKWNTWHTIGMWWKDKNNIQFYINGEAAGSVTTNQDFTLSQNIIWDLWTSPESWFCGLANKADLQDETINTMYVDWIHTYILEPSASALNEIGTELMNVYPNPVSNILNINLNLAPENNSIAKIYDNVGRLVKLERLVSIDTQIQFSDLNAGIYIVKVINGSSNYSKLIVKNK